MDTWLRNSTSVSDCWSFMLTEEKEDHHDNVTALNVCQQRTSLLTLDSNCGTCEEAEERADHHPELATANDGHPSAPVCLSP